MHAEQIVKWMEAGGQAGLGSHGEAQGLGTHWELWMMASGGMDNHDALRMATLMSADAIGLAGDIGSIDTLTEVWPRRRPLPTQRWWRVEPPEVRRQRGR